MKTLTKLLLFLFLPSLLPSINAQTEGNTKSSSFEINAAIYVPRGLVSDAAPLSVLTPIDTVGVNFLGGENPELQIKYVKELNRNISWYGTVAVGTYIFTQQLNLADTFLTFSPNSRFPEREFFTERTSVNYGSLAGGIRMVLHIKKNDAFNFSLGAKGVFYPKQTVGVSQIYPSDIHSANIELRSESTLENAAKLVGGLEFDMNYQFGFKNNRLKLQMGVIIDRVRETVFDVDSEVILPISSFSYRHLLGGGRIGLYLGVAYGLQPNVI